MLQLRPTLLRPIAHAVVALALASLTGCVPVVWLPDSSGFIYVKPTKVAGVPSGQLMQYDLQKKTSHVIVADIGAGTQWPALSSDGQRIAVARLAGGPKEAKTVQIALYDLQGKQLHLSKAFTWAQTKKTPEFMLFWSPKNDMVVVSNEDDTGFYNVKTDSLKIIEKSMPVIHGGTPIRPDGKGVLLLSEAGKVLQLAFMDWEGKGEIIDADALVALAPKDKTPGSPLLFTVVSALTWPSWWDGDAALVGYKRDKATYAIDTVKKKIDFTAAFAAQAKVDKKDVQAPIHFDFAGDITIQAIQFRESPKGPTLRKIIAVNNTTKKEDILLAKGPDMTLFLPSPDGNYLALCLTSFGPSPELNGGDDRILVINNKGELVSNLSFER